MHVAPPTQLVKRGFFIGKKKPSHGGLNICLIEYMSIQIVLIGTK